MLAGRIIFVEGTLKRVISGIILIPIIIGIVLYAPLFIFTAVTALVAVLSLIEYDRISSLPLAGDTDDGDQNARSSVGRGSSLLAGVLFPVCAAFSGVGVQLFLVFIVMVYFFIRRLRSPSLSGAAFSGALSDVGLRLLGALYVGLTLAHFVMLRRLDEGAWWVLFAFVVIWLSDTCAYYGGTLTGRTKLAPSISPGKTVEGALWGVAGAVAVAILFVKLIGFDTGGMGLFTIAVIAVIVSVAGIIGDLAESLFKRSFGVKDSGTLIPGHGGMLDRVDSLLFAVPVLYYLINFHETFCV